MEQNFQTSFIPKKPIIKDRVVSSAPISIFLVGAIFVLFTVLLATGGIYFYKLSLQKNITDMKDTLLRAKGRFEITKIAELQLLDKRLRAASDILSKHISVSPIFSALEKITMKTVRYTNFSYSFGGGKNSNLINIKMAGIAKGYRYVAMQSDLFATNRNLINPIFSNLNLDTNGNVLFDLEFLVDPSFVNYKQTLLTQN